MLWAKGNRVTRSGDESFRDAMLLVGAGRGDGHEDTQGHEVRRRVVGIERIDDTCAT